MTIQRKMWGIVLGKQAKFPDKLFSTRQEAVAYAVGTRSSWKELRKYGCRTIRVTATVDKGQ